MRPKSNPFRFIIMMGFGLWFQSCGSSPIQPVLEKIAGHDVIELKKIKALSIESSVEWKTDSESAPRRWMRYHPIAAFQKPNEVEVYIPVDGTLTGVYPAQAESPLRDATLIVQAKANPHIYIELSGVDLLSHEWGEDKVVKAGMHCGYVHVSPQSGALSVRVVYRSARQEQDYPLTAIMAEYVFEHYRQRGIQAADLFEASMDSGSENGSEGGTERKAFYLPLQDL